MEFSFDTPNLVQYERMLIEMGTKTARAVGRKALRQGTNVVLAESRRLAKAGHPLFPARVTGLLARSLVTHDRGIHGDTILFSVDLRRRAFYGRFVEFGTSRSKAYPFMRPAAQNKAKEAVVVMSEALRVGIELQWGSIR